MKHLAVFALTATLAGCGRYAEFTLPQDGFAARSGTWKVTAAAGPLIPRGANGEWDAVDALNPSVALRDGVYYNLYSGFDGKTWHSGFATSPDGARWTKRGRVLSPDPATWEGNYIAANGSLLGHPKFQYWYQAGEAPRIGLARSTDGIHWSKHGAPVLEDGPRGSWDERAVADPDVLFLDGVYYMYYLGSDRAQRQRLGVAVSADGIVWTKLRGNPILDLGAAGAFDENGLGEPAVWRSGGWYWMLYTGRSRTEQRAIGLAQSRDGVSWRKTGTGAFFRGREPWNSQVVCDPTVLEHNGIVRVWYGGGDVAHPAERIHGQIGYFEMAPTP